MTKLKIERFILAVSVLLLILSGLSGCGGKYGNENNSIVAVEVSGTLSLRGSQPYPILLLETGDGGEYLLRSPDKLDELKNLKGMRVILTGTTPKHSSVTIPVLSVENYSLLPLPGGEEPLVGTLAVADERCVLRIEKETLLMITGEFERVLSGFPGAKVWVIGERGTDGELRVTGYGIIVPSGP
jgi:hypothetical protein